VLAFDAAVLAVDLFGLDRLEVDAVLPAGGLWLVEAETPEHERALVDAAFGLSPPLDGVVRFRDHDWQVVPAAFRDALRGRCGLIARESALVPHASLAENILAPARYHRRTPDAELAAEAAALARRFGLPGLPTGRVAEEGAADRLRAACVRAFLGAPLFVAVESRAQPWRRELIAPLVDAMLQVCERGGAVLWSVVDDPLFDDAAIPATTRYRLRGRGLLEVTA
jgi:phospholipid/cholesterol/gamma-HCH transport system ATP-binding protein